MPAWCLDTEQDNLLKYTKLYSDCIHESWRYIRSLFCLRLSLGLNCKLSNLSQFKDNLSHRWHCCSIYWATFDHNYNVACWYMCSPSILHRNRCYEHVQRYHNGCGQSFLFPLSLQPHCRDWRVPTVWQGIGLDFLLFYNILRLVSHFCTRCPFDITILLLSLASRCYL